MDTEKNPLPNHPVANPMELSWIHQVERWAALRTSARWEKQVSVALTQVGVPNFLPLKHHKTSYRGKLRETEVPLFTGYVFCSELDFIGNSAILPATRNKVAQVLKTTDQSLIKAELEQVAFLCTSYKLIQEKTYGEVGSRVIIREGSMKGMEGIIARFKPEKKQIVVKVTLIGLQVEVAFDEFAIEPPNG